MAVQPCLAIIRAASDIAQVNVRTAPSLRAAVVRQMRVGTGGLRVVDVQPDREQTAVNGRVYQWFQLSLPDGNTGWIRDDLLLIQGACGAFGYSTLAVPTRAASLARDTTPDVETPSEPVPSEERERVRKAAFNITAGFEGNGYDAYQTFDSGIVSYGRFQCTLASGALEAMLQTYLKTAKGTRADQLKYQYMPRIKTKDYTLRNDEGLKTLLVQLADDPVMQAAQDEYATDAYFVVAERTSMIPRGIATPLGQAMVFDMAVHHGGWGTERDYLRPAEQSLGAGIKSKLGENGLSERQYLRRVGEIRRTRLYAIANARGWGGLKVRADFWMERMNAGDWDLRGDAQGEVETMPGKKVRVIGE